LPAGCCKDGDKCVAIGVVVVVGVVVVFVAVESTFSCPNPQESLSIFALFLGESSCEADLPSSSSSPSSMYVAVVVVIVAAVDNVLLVAVADVSPAAASTSANALLHTNDESSKSFPVCADADSVLTGGANGRWLA